MPELPEVETIRSQLEKLIVGKKITKVDVGLPRMVKLSLDKFRKIVVGAKIESIGRRAKILIFGLSNGWSMLIHLKLSGRLIFRKKGEILKDEDAKWNHLIYYFQDGSRLFHNDLRQFGYVKLIETDKLADFFKKEKLGPEPLKKYFTFEDFSAILKRKPKAKIKQFLMDQQNISGIGNIYSDEILFFAGVHPLRKISELKPKETKKTFQGIKKILTEALKLQGSSVDLYLNALGKEGEYVPRLKVYGREGEKCKKCGGAIQRLKIGGRSAHYCPSCQKVLN
ncbi:MAG: DNA-formamidopyrimidine glycosylase [Parcubacteria group bacterium]|uniref:DNA-formamidopyrimidine glycosylase n=1 Tax=Candidatus Wolfebacteria bacterium CG_4_10_14_0_8_um_filter_39_64 TaxID=1975063 RepID=A0A2M7Q7S0_9BACT|nr:DNA-formamidopyrimidine glycosylase [Parcubacteria group bacterium]PIY59162.1 MAG: DNA-formamidopyrimidine glycosylase [Candidatus Wolfebacteria bacterium CG_4_10_14_0_8_um_filter_39_64]